MLKNRILYAVFTAAVIICFFTTWPWEFYFLFIIALLLPLFSLLLSVSAVKKINYELSVPSSVPRGGRLTIALRDRSSSRWLSYHIELETSISGGEPMLHSAELFFGRSNEIIIETEHCCSVRCHVKAAYACDLLGLFRLRLFRVPDRVTVAAPTPSPMSGGAELAASVSSSLRPKPGGGFSEIHEMREYRPGDPVRDIHWKLSAKTDRMIIREPQTQDGGIFLITLDLVPISSELDLILDRTAWLSLHLILLDITHDIRFLSPGSGKVISVTVSDKASFEQFLREVLSVAVSSPLPSITEFPFDGIGRRIHIKGEVQK